MDEELKELNPFCCCIVAGADDGNAVGYVIGDAADDDELNDDNDEDGIEIVKPNLEPLLTAPLFGDVRPVVVTVHVTMALEASLFEAELLCFVEFEVVVVVAAAVDVLFL